MIVHYEVAVDIPCRIGAVLFGSCSELDLGRHLIAYGILLDRVGCDWVMNEYSFIILFGKFLREASGIRHEAQYG
jgi:hypothetical protein